MSPKITRNFALYKSIKNSYEENLKTADFDKLIDDVDRSMSSALCVALKDADAYKQSLFKTKIVVPHLAKSVDRILFNVTSVTDESIRRYKFFLENWSELMQDLSTIPETLHPYVLPMVHDRSGQSALSFTRFVNREVEKIEKSILFGSMQVSQFYIWFNSTLGEIKSQNSTIKLNCFVSFFIAFVAILFVIKLKSNFVFVSRFDREKKMRCCVINWKLVKRSFSVSSWVENEKFFDTIEWKEDTKIDAQIKLAKEQIFNTDYRDINRGILSTNEARRNKMSGEHAFHEQPMKVLSLSTWARHIVTVFWWKKASEIALPKAVQTLKSDSKGRRWKTKRKKNTRKNELFLFGLQLNCPKQLLSIRRKSCDLFSVRKDNDDVVGRFPVRFRNDADGIVYSDERTHSHAHQLIQSTEKIFIHFQRNKHIFDAFHDETKRFRRYCFLLFFFSFVFCSLFCRTIESKSQSHVTIQALETSTIQSKPLKKTKTTTWQSFCKTL